MNDALREALAEALDAAMRPGVRYSVTDANLLAVRILAHPDVIAALSEPAGLVAAHVRLTHHPVVNPAYNEGRPICEYDSDSWPCLTELQVREGLRLAATPTASPTAGGELPAGWFPCAAGPGYGHVTAEQWDACRICTPTASPTAGGEREYHFRTWDDTRLVVSVDADDPGDMGEPRMVVDYDNGWTTYVSVRAVLAATPEQP